MCSKYVFNTGFYILASEHALHMHTIYNVCADTMNKINNCYDSDMSKIRRVNLSKWRLFWFVLFNLLLGRL